MGPWRSWIFGTVWLDAGVFVPMEELEFFRQVTVDRESGTVSWPNGVDFCPDVLYAEATGKVISEMGSKLELI
jgi:hypothetical protein